MNLELSMPTSGKNLPVCCYEPSEGGIEGSLNASGTVMCVRAGMSVPVASSRWLALETCLGDAGGSGSIPDAGSIQGITLRGVVGRRARNVFRDVSSNNQRWAWDPEKAGSNPAVTTTFPVQPHREL